MGEISPPRWTVFRGQFRHTIDTKGRVSIPAKFREAEAGIAGDKLVIVPNGVALEVHPFQKWEELEQRVNALPRFDQDAREIRHRYLSLGQDVSLDAHGRIQVPQDYREASGCARTCSSWACRSTSRSGTWSAGSTR